jgi:hypothetical protein
LYSDGQKDDVSAGTAKAKQFITRLQVMQKQARSIQAAGEEAKLIAAAAIDAQVERFVARLQHTDGTILGGASADISA